uniref:SMODS and SLOG-associating 2TM effector domain-containing protein n=1 Tax=viral metagenome TaxID=1070528 RepID=A0A6C0LCV6_9ZZZZ
MKDIINKNNEIQNDSDVKINIYNEQYNNLKTQEDLDNEDKEYNYLNLEYENIKWKEYHENILVDWADKALCYRWLHTKSSSKYIRLRNLYTIPVIILSTLTGTANFALERVPEQYQGLCQIGIGSLNILAGIITTVSQFLKINELSEAHRVSSISWDKFYRNIRVELVKCPEDRTNVGYLIKSCKDEYDRLIETCPTIDTNIINYFNKTFKVKSKIDDEKKKDALKSLSKPEILDSLESTRNIVYKVDKKFNNNNLMNIIKSKKNQLEKEDIVNNFIETFEKEFSRKPSIIEIYDNLDHKISQSVINKYLSSSKWLNINK